MQPTCSEFYPQKYFLYPAPRTYMYIQRIQIQIMNIFEILRDTFLTLVLLFLLLVFYLCFILISLFIFYFIQVFRSLYTFRMMAFQFISSCMIFYFSFSFVVNFLFDCIKSECKIQKNKRKSK